MRLRHVLGCLVLMFASAPVLAQEAWSVTLTQKQAKALAAIKFEPKFTAFAISPDGAWGWSKGVNTPENAAARALEFCQGELRPKKRDCFVYEVAGKRVAPEVVQTRRVSMVYKPLNGRTAAKLFGRVNFNFQGDASIALAQLAEVPSTRADLPEDRTLRMILQDRSIMTTKTKGVAITFEESHAEQSALAQSGILKIYYDSWAVTAAGLVCMFDGYYPSSGKRVGTNCLILNSATQGLVSMSWGRKPKAVQKMQLIAGDARFSKAK